MESSPIDAHPKCLSPKANEKTVEDNCILDSPVAQTILEIRRQATTSNVNGFEEPPFETTTLSKKKKTREPIKKKTIVVEKQSRVNLVFNEDGQLIGDESIGLTSFLRPLVREVVPMNLENSLKLSTRLKVVLWRSIKVLNYLISLK